MPKLWSPCATNSMPLQEVPASVDLDKGDALLETAAYVLEKVE
jgi:hypothetical protein